MPELEKKDEQIDRAAMAAEVWNEDAEPSPSPAEVKPEAKEVVAEKVKDPWEGVPPAVRTELETLRQQTGSIGTMETRLKQAESRLGGVLNELHAAKEAAKVVANAPSKEQIAEAAQSQKEWDTLKEDFPEWTKATDARLAAERAEILKQMPDVTKIREEIKAEVKAEAQAELNKVRVEIKYPDWEATVNTPEFKQWGVGRDSSDPKEVIKILDEFTEYQASRKSPTEIAAERKKRLEHSEVKGGHAPSKAKSEDDMTETEIRNSIAKQVWS